MPTVLEWVRKLETEIEQQIRYAKPYETRYKNEHILPFIAQEYREVYGSSVDGVLFGILDAPRTGTAAIGIDALVQRLTVTGATSDDAATARALQIAWEDNALDVMHREGHREAMIGARSFGAASRSTTGSAIATIESPTQAAIHRMKAPPYDVDAYLKVWIDEWTGARAGLLQLPERDINLVEGDTMNPDPEGSNVTSRWTVASETPRPGPVPVVEFAHRPRLLEKPSSELERIATEIDIVDLIEGLMVFAGHFGAVPIRYATGLEIPRDPKDPSKPLIGPDGKPLVGFKPRADHFWANSSKDAKFGQLEPAGLASFVTWAEHSVGVIKRQTSVPSTYYSLDLKSHMSAELLKTDEAPMLRRVWEMGRDGNFNHSWRRLLTIMMTIEGHPGRVRPLWADPQTRIESQAVDSFQKAVASGLGVSVAAEQFLGWDPDLVKKAVEEAEAKRQLLRDEGEDAVTRLSRDFLNQ